MPGFWPTWDGVSFATCSFGGSPPDERDATTRTEDGDVAGGRRAALVVRRPDFDGAAPERDRLRRDDAHCRGWGAGDGLDRLRRTAPTGGQRRLLHLQSHRRRRHHRRGRQRRLVQRATTDERNGRRSGAGLLQDAVRRLQRLDLRLAGAGGRGLGAADLPVAGSREQLQRSALRLVERDGDRLVAGTLPRVVRQPADLFSRDPPRRLDDPGDRSVLSDRLVLSLPQHGRVKVERDLFLRRRHSFLRGAEEVATTGLSEEGLVRERYPAWTAGRRPGWRRCLWCSSRRGPPWWRADRRWCRGPRG